MASGPVEAHRPGEARGGEDLDPVRGLLSAVVLGAVGWLGALWMLRRYR